MADAPRTDRVPPHNLQAEESLLGAMLLSKRNTATTNPPTEGETATQTPVAKAPANEDPVETTGTAASTQPAPSAGRGAPFLAVFIVLTFIRVPGRKTTDPWGTCSIRWRP